MSVEKVPSDPVDVLDLRFRQLRRIDLNSYNATGHQSEEKRKSLVAASSKYGLVFLGIGTNLVVLKTADIETLDVLSSKEQRKTDASDFPAQLAPLPSEALFVSLSSDSLTLAVCCMRNGGCCVLFYDVRSFAKRDTTPGWFLEARLSSTSSVTVADFVWNPGQGNAYAYCLSDGTVGIAEVVETSLEIKATRPDMKASALSWSPKGKQIFVGTTTGQMIQCKPDLKEVKSVSPPPSLSAIHAICGILWISTNQVATAYINRSDPDPRPLFHIINMGKNVPNEYINYDDICYGGGQEVAASFYNMQHIPEWGVILCTSATAAEVAVLGREGTADPPAWQQWNVDGSWRAELPFILKGDQTYPLGTVLDYSSQQRIPWGENETLDPMPLLYLLSTGGSLCPFQVINLKAGSPVLTHPSQTLSSEQARRSVVTLPAAPAVIQPQKTPSSFGFGSVITQASKPAPVAVPVEIKAPAAVLPAAVSIPAPAAFASVAPPFPISHPPFQRELPAPTKNSVTANSVTASTDSKAKAGSAATILAFKQGIAAFEEELKAFKQRASKINAPIGTDAEKSQLIQQTASMQSFCSELIATTVAQETEIRNLKSSNLEVAAWLEEAKSRELRSKDEKYKHLLKLRSLDPASQRKMNEINRLRDYLTQQLQEAMRKQDQLLEDSRRTPMSPKTWLPPSSELVFQTLVRHEHLLGELSDRKEKIVAQLRILQKKRHALCLSYPGFAPDKKNLLENGGSDLARLAESLLISHGKSSPASPSQSRYTQNALSPEKQAFIRDSLSHRPVRVIRTHVPSPTKPSRMMSTLTDDSKKELPKLRPDVQQVVSGRAAINEILAKPIPQAQQLPKQTEKSTFTNIAAAQAFSKPSEPPKPSDGLKIPTPSTLFKVPSSGGLNFLENKVAPNISVPATAAPISMKPLITEPPKEVPKPPTTVATIKIQAKEPRKPSASPSVLFQGTGFVLGGKTEEKPRETPTTVTQLIQPKEEPKLQELPPLKPVSAPASTPSAFSGFGLVKSESSTSLASKPDSPALISITPVVQPLPTEPQTGIKPISTPAPVMNSPPSYATSTPQESAASSLGMIAALASSVDKELASATQAPRVNLSQTPTTSEPTKSAFNVPSFTAGVTSPPSMAFSFSLPTSTTVSGTTNAPSVVPDRVFGGTGTTNAGLTITPVKVAATQAQPVSLFKAFGDQPDQPTVTTAESQSTASKPFSSSSFTFALPGTGTGSITSATTPTSSLFGSTAPVFGQASFGMPAGTGGTAAGTGTTSIFGQSAFGMNKASTAPVAPMTGGSIFGQSSFGAAKTSEVTPTSVLAAPTANVFGQSTFGAPKTSDATTTSSVFGQPSFGAPKTSEATPTGTSSSLFGQNAFGLTSAPTSATTTTSVFGQSMFGAAAAPPATSNVFGQSSTFGFAQAAGATSSATGTSLFGQAAFANNAASPSTPVFGGTGFGTQSTPQQSMFGGNSAAAASSGMKPADSFGGGGNAFQGLGASPNPANVNKNVFGGGSFGATGQQSLFGSAAAQPSAPFGAPSASASQGFGAFGSPNKPVFGVSASFGGSPAFGAAQVSPAKAFGAVAAHSGAGFGNFAAASTLPTFGSLASGQPPQFGGLPAATPQPPAPAPSFGGGTAFSSWR